MDKYFKSFVIHNLKEGSIHLDNEKDIIGFTKSIFKSLSESELKKIDTSSNSSYFACQSHVIYILAEANYYYRDEPFKDAEAYEKYCSLYRKIIKQTLNYTKDKDWPKLLMDCAYYHPNVFWILADVLNKKNPKLLENSILNTSKNNKEKFNLIDFYMSNYVKSSRHNKYQANFHHSYLPSKLMNKFFKIISENNLYKINPLSYLMSNYHKDTKFFDLFLKYFPVHYDTIALALEKNIPTNKIQLLVNNGSYEELIKNQLEVEEYTYNTYRSEFQIKLKKTHQLDGSLLDSLYRKSYSLDQSLLDYQVKQYKFIQKNLKESLNFKSKKNRLFNHKITSIIKRYSSYKKMVKYLTGFETPYSLKKVSKNLIVKKTLNQDFMLSLLFLKEILKSKKVSQEEYFRLIEAKYFKEVFNCGYNNYSSSMSDNVIKFLRLFSVERLERLFNNDFSSDDSLRMLLNDSTSMCFKNKEIQEELFEMRFNKMNNFSKLHNRLVEISSKFDVDYQDFKNKNTMKLFKSFDNIKVQDLVLRLPKNSHYLRSWAKRLNNCIASSHYGDEFSEGKNILYGVYKDDVVLYNIEITNKKINQFEAKYRKEIDEEHYDLVVNKLKELKLIK